MVTVYEGGDSEQSCVTDRKINPTRNYGVSPDSCSLNFDLNKYQKIQCNNGKMTARFFNNKDCGGDPLSTTELIYGECAEMDSGIAHMRWEWVGTESCDPGIFFILIFFLQT